MPDYSKGKIYRIVNNENDKVYYGSTTQLLSKRLHEHRKKHNDCMSKNLGVDLKECLIILVEQLECNNKQELLMRERFYIENNECVNKQIPIRTEEEKEQQNQIDYLKHTEKRKESVRQYRKENKEKVAIQQHKKYLNNQEKKKDESKQYYKEKKILINEKAKIPMTCVCGSTFRKSDKARHEKSKKHQEFIK